MVHCGDSLITTDEINAYVDKIIGYESPIEKIYRDVETQIIKHDEEEIMYAVNQAVGYAVDKEELIKALQYDRQQYEKGYEDTMSVIEDIKAEINELSELDHIEPTYEDCKRDVLEIINKLTSGAKMEDEE